MEKITDYTQKDLSFVHENSSLVQSSLVQLNNYLECQLLLTEREYLVFSGIIRDLKSFAVQFEYLMRIKNHEVSLISSLSFI